MAWASLALAVFVAAWSAHAVNAQNLPDMQGTLFKYGNASANVAFMSGDGSATHHVVLVHGITDGLFSVPYAQSLAEALARIDGNWTLVQPLMRSSHQAFGIGSIDEDADDLLQLLTVLRERYGSQGVVLLGHSTGCQDSVRYAQLYRNSSEAAELLGLVLQAPVSDPDYLATQPETNGRLAAAEALAAAGRADQTAFRATEMDGAAVTAERWLSLAEHGGDEDMFSANLTAGQRAAIFAQLVGLPTLVLQGGADEYIPAGLDPGALGNATAAGIGPSAELVVIEEADHGLEGREDEVAALIAGFVGELAA